MLDNVRFGKGSLGGSGQVVYRRAVCLDRLHDCRRDFVSRGVWKADVENGPVGGQRGHSLNGE
jgi:hypothetical protein